MSDAIEEQIAELRETVVLRLQRLEEQLSTGRDAVQVLEDGLHAYRERILKDVADAPLLRLAGRIRADTRLGYPHRKILDCLLEQYDRGSGQFEELCFSVIWKRARVGKNKLRGYLTELIGRGYIVERCDGYRKHYKMQERSV